VRKYLRSFVAALACAIATAAIAAAQEASPALQAEVTKLVAAMPNAKIGAPKTVFGGCVGAARPVSFSADGKKVSGYLNAGFVEGTLKSGEDAIIATIDDCTNHHYGSSVVVFAGPKGRLAYAGFIAWPMGSISNGLIRVQIPVFAKNEALCCLTHSRVRIYEVTAGRIKLISESVVSNG
jgi:hypothetical protein